MENVLGILTNYFTIHGVGYTFSIVIGHYLVRLVVDELWKPFQNDRPKPYHPQMLGVLERALYTASWLLGRPEFIAVWLALKVAAQFRRWVEPTRETYNIF